MTKKLTAAAAALVMCFTFASCGSTDTSDTSGAAVSPWGQTSEAGSSAAGESKAEDSKAEESKAEESKAEESKAEESKAEESKAEESKAETVTEESKAGEPAESKAQPEESKAEQTVSEAETTPAEGSFVVKGTGYTVEFGEGWMDMADIKDDFGKQSAAAAREKFGLDDSSFTGMDVVCAYKPDGVSQVPVFNVVDPVVNSLFKSVKIADLESALTMALQQQMAGQEGFKLENKGIVSYNGADFLELYTEYKTDSAVAKARQFFALNGDKEYVISFSIPGDMYDDFLSETEKVMKTFKFTEG